MASAMKGRGALSNPPGRFDKLTKIFEHDGWTEEAPPDHVETVVLPEPSRSIISRNQSPDIGFSQSINPYRGCSHGCSYCLGGDTSILMGNGATKPLAELRRGDEIFGTKRVGWYRRYIKTRVLAHWSVIKPAYRVTLEDGTSLVTGPDHRFLTERGWKFVTNSATGSAQRAHLTTNNKLMGVGKFVFSVAKGRDYRLGYVTGMIRGDGHLASYSYKRKNGRQWTSHRFRLALCDDEALNRTGEYLRNSLIEANRFLFAVGSSNRKAMNAISTSATANVDEIRRLISWPANPSNEWYAGGLSAILCESRLH